MLMNKKKSFIIRHRFLLVSLLCLFGVCVVAQVKPAAGQQKKVEKKSDDSAKNKKGTAKKKPVDKRKRVDLLHADEAHRRSYELPAQFDRVPGIATEGDVLKEPDGPEIAPAGREELHQ